MTSAEVIGSDAITKHITVGSDLIYVIGSVKSDMWERKSVPCAGRMGSKKMILKRV